MQHNPNQPISPGSGALAGAAWSLVALAGVAALLAVVAIADTAEASHFRYGTLSWESTGASNEIVLDGTVAWRKSYNTRFSSAELGDVVQLEDYIEWGDRSTTRPFMQVTAISEQSDWFLGTLVDENGFMLRHTYDTPVDADGDPWVIQYDTCCRLGTSTSGGNHHENNGGQDFRLETTVDLRTPNHSPKALLAPINPCKKNTVCTLEVPFLDPDGDALTYRFATGSEPGCSCFDQPGDPDAPHDAELDPLTGILTWDTAGADAHSTLRTLYSVQVMAEDGKTKTPIDFFIELTDENVELPEWSMENPCPTTCEVPTGEEFRFPVSASTGEPGVTVSLEHLGLPPGASFPIPEPAQSVTSEFSWTPAPHLAGRSFIVVFTAEDSRGYMGGVFAVKLKVIDPKPELQVERGMLEEVNSGEVVVVTLDLTNVGTADGTGTVVTETFPSSYTLLSEEVFVPFTGSGWVYGSPAATEDGSPLTMKVGATTTTLTWDLGTLARGETITIRYRLLAPAEASGVTLASGDASETVRASVDADPTHTGPAEHAFVTHAETTGPRDRVVTEDLETTQRVRSAAATDPEGAREMVRDGRADELVL